MKITLQTILLFIFALITVLAPLTSQSETQKAKVILISVADESDAFWSGIHSISEATAKDLGIDFEIMFSNRNHLVAITMAQEIATRKKKPDYVIVVGEKLIASKSIPVLANSGIKVFLFGDLTIKEKEMIGEPREKYPNYIGKRLIDDYMAGYLTAEFMVQEATRKKLYDRDGMINFLALEGVRETPFNYERMRGLTDVLKKHPNVNVLQAIPTNWKYNNAIYALPFLLKRYANYKIAGIWCANSELARASTDILKLSGKIPGVDYVVAGTDWDIESVKSVSKGDLLGIAGGHVATVAWILTIIHDYHNGIDFDLNTQLNKVSVLDKESSDKYLKLFKDNHWDIIDFSTFSKTENEKLERYNFSFDAVFDSIK